MHAHSLSLALALTPTLSQYHSTTATAISALSINLGAASAFILGPALVNQPGDMSMYMYVTAAISFLVALPIFAFFPAAPPTPPSVAAQSILAAEGARQDASILSINATFDHEDLPFAKRRQDSSFDIGLAITEANAQRMSSATSIGAIKGASNALFESGGASTLGIASAVLDNDVPPLAFDSLRQELWYCMTHPSFACLALSGGFVLGVYNGWAGSYVSQARTHACAHEHNRIDSCVIDRSVGSTLSSSLRTRRPRSVGSALRH